MSNKDDEVSIMNIIDDFIDDIKVLIVFLAFILFPFYFAFNELVNVTFLNIISWIIIALAVMDLVMTIVDIVIGFLDENFGGSIISIVVNLIFIGLSIWFAFVIISFFSERLSLLYSITIGVIIFNILSLIIAAITLDITTILESVRLILIFAIVIVGLYNILAFNINQQITEFFGLLYDILIYFIFGILLFDIVLCIIDFVKGLHDGLNIGDFIAIILNIIIFCTLILCTIFSNGIFVLIFKNIEIIKNFTFTIKLFIGFVLYVIVDLSLAVIVNFISKIVDLVND